MKKSVKIAMLIASILCGAGVILSAVGLFAIGFDFSRLNTHPIQTNTHEVEEEFASISIQTNTADVIFVLSEDEECKVVCQEFEKLTHSVSVEDGTLVIKVQDNRKWYDHIGFFFGRTLVTVYLPEAEYLSLSIESDTGDVEMPKDFRFGEAKVETDTGALLWKAFVLGSFEITTDTGDISLESVAVTKTLTIETATGKVSLDEVWAVSINMESNTGDVDFCNTVASNSISVKTNTGDVSFYRATAGESLRVVTDTGDVTFDRADAASISVTTDTGDVTGTLLSEKIFFTESDTGHIRVPQSMTGGKCEIKTDTGDIEIEIVD